MMTARGERLGVMLNSCLQLNAVKMSCMTIEISQNVLINLLRKRELLALSTSHAAPQVIVESEKVLSDVRLLKTLLEKSVLRTSSFG